MEDKDHKSMALIFLFILGSAAIVTYYMSRPVTVKLGIDTYGDLVFKNGDIIPAGAYSIEITTPLYVLTFKDLEDIGLPIWELEPSREPSIFESPPMTPTPA